MAETGTNKSSARAGTIYRDYPFLDRVDGYVLQISALITLLGMTIIFALSAGRYPVPFSTVISILIDNFLSFTGEDGQSWGVAEERVVEFVRLPRILVVGLCGAALSLSGAGLQGMFRNSLVGPQIIGVSSGAAFGGVLVIMLMLADYFIPLFAFVFGVVALMITMSIAKAGGGKNVLSLVLGGIVTSAFFTSLVSLVKYTADPEDSLPTIDYWLLGSYNDSSFKDNGMDPPHFIYGFKRAKMETLTTI